MKFPHELKEAKELYEAVAYEKEIEPYLVDKDYWIMYAFGDYKSKILILS